MQTITQEALFSRISRVPDADRQRRYMNPGEGEVLASLVNAVQPKDVLEIGVNEGFTARELLRSIPSIERYVGVDVLPGYQPGKIIQLREIPKRPAHLVRDHRFQLELRKRGTFDIKAGELGQFDAVFIDGDHGEEAVKHDSVLAFDTLRERGIAIWHDYHDLGTVDVKPVLDDLSTRLPLVHVEGTWLVYLTALEALGGQPLTS